MQIHEIIERVNELINMRIDIDRELNEIQQLCKHDEFKIGNHKDYRHTNNVKICKHCSSCIGYPTPNELRDDGYLI